MRVNDSLLEAALIGYQEELNRVDQLMTNLRQRIAATQRAIPKTSRLSAGARERIAVAQRKRWAEYKAKLAGK
jgi:hypothetical protein